MEKHLIFFDIDGTLLNEKTRSVSEKTKEAIREARKNGHKAFINTGRNFAELDNRILEIGFDGVVCGCGVYIEHDREVQLNRVIDSSVAKEIVEDIERYKLNAILEGVEYIYIRKDAKKEEKMFMEEFFGKEIQGRIISWDEPKLEFGKFTVFMNADSNYNSFYKKYKDKFQFIKRENSFAEVIPIGYSKATGIQFLMDKFDVKRKHTIAIGDSENDLAMLEYAGIGIAMGNSIQKVFEKVDYKTETIDNEGIYHALKHFNII